MPEDDEESQEVVTHGPLVRVRAGGSMLDPEYEDMTPEAASHWDVTAWRQA